MMKTMIPAIAISFTNFVICACSGDVSSLILRIDSPILPMRVAVPICSTIKMASPETVLVPLKTLLSVDELSLNIEKLSPVSEDSFTEKSLL